MTKALLLGLSRSEFTKTASNSDCTRNIYEDRTVNGIRRILIINGKGGCGKTTIATNLAVAYAQQGRSTALMDYDSQASSTDWAELRMAHSRTTLPLRVVPMHRRVGMYQTRAFHQQLPRDIERVVIDTPSGARERDIDTLIKQCDLILVPMLPSPLDIRSGSRFIAELLTHRSFRANPRALGVIANRLQPGASGTSDTSGPGTEHQLAPNQQKLLHALECLDVPCVANFTDSALYGQAAEDGLGITELDVADPTSAAEQARWFNLVNWVEAQPKRAEQLAAPPRAVATATARSSATSGPTDRQAADNDHTTTGQH